MSDFIQSDFKLPKTTMYHRVPNSLLRLLAVLLKVKPQAKLDKCKSCGVCVKSCLMGAISDEKYDTKTIVWEEYQKTKQKYKDTCSSGSGCLLPEERLLFSGLRPLAGLLRSSAVKAVRSSRPLFASFVYAIYFHRLSRR